MKKDWLAPLVFWLLFEAVAVTLWLSLNNLFYLFNFSYIGTCLAVGIYLYSRKWKYARNAVQWAVGLYMLVYLGLIDGENMQIEGFWYYLFLGVFEAATIHYFVAKIAGPLFFGRGWCGFACWTAWCWMCCPISSARLRAKTGRGCAMRRSPYRFCM